MNLKEILNRLRNGDLKYCYDHKSDINREALRLLELPKEEALRKENLEALQDLIMIGNITYNNTSRNVLPIEDGVYDLLATRLQSLDYDRFTPGNETIYFDESSIEDESKDIQYPFIMMNKDDRKYEEDMIFRDVMNMRKPLSRDQLLIKPFTIGGVDVSKRLRNVDHNYPDLVGTLHKCKFVTDKQAIDLGVYEDPNVDIFERDFIAPLLVSGELSPTQSYGLVATLKYDGVSVEADVTDRVVGARTRGDTDNNKAADLTPILGGYRFPNAPKLETPIGMKFEAIIRNDDLYRLNEEKGTSYINGRTAIIGILGSSDAWKYRDYITLVPLQADLSNINQSFKDRIEEIQFLNQYYTNMEYLRWTYMEGNYTSLIFQVKRFVEEMEFARSYIPFMYDGVVIEFLDNNLRQKLGRKNSINQYAMAVKFNALTKQTVFRGYTYTIGQNGAITPMLHYDPVEFLGSIHTKSTGSSYGRFKELDLRIGDIINVTYVNDVMPYVTRCEVDANIPNHTREKLPEEEFVDRCPSCGSKLILSNSGLSKLCPNLDCGNRVVQRMANMLAKLGIKDFSDAAVKTLGISHFLDLITMTDQQLQILGPTNAVNLKRAINNLFENKLPDYRIIGALGFSGIAAKKWKTIFEKYSLKDVLSMWYNGSLVATLANIKGVGPTTAEIINSELDYFEKDVKYIVDTEMYIPSKIGDASNTFQIRFTGFRDRELEAVLNRMENVDCDGDASVTKKTSILLVPYDGYNQGNKCTKAIKYGIPIVSIKEFLEDPDKFMQAVNG